MTNFIKNIKSKDITNILLILGIIILAYNDKDGWGWLLFLLIIKD
jgi:hypothetical protein